MDIIQAIIIGIVQGLTEFLPVSSSAHLVFIPSLQGVQSSLAYRYITTHRYSSGCVCLFLERHNKHVKVVFLQFDRHTKRTVPKGTLKMTSSKDCPGWL